MRESLPASTLVRAIALDGSLRARVVGLAESLAGRSWFVALIESGEAQFSGDEGPVAAPVLVWRPWTREARVTFAPGTVGTYVVLGAAALANAIGHIPESRELREASDRNAALLLDATTGTFAALRASFSGLRREQEHGAPGSRAVITVHLRVILIELYRNGTGQSLGADNASPSERIFLRFAALIEQHFRDRWTVKDYAASLGVSRDRLGDVCLRVRDLGPKELIDRRVALEACLQLERSSNSLQQVAGLLGFSSPAQFNRFFRRVVGQTPGLYRDQVRQQSGELASVRHYDWP